MRTNLSSCLGLIDNGQYKSTKRLLVLMPHERPHGIMRILEILCMLLPKALKMRERRKLRISIQPAKNETAQDELMPWMLP